MGFNHYIVYIMADRSKKALSEEDKLDAYIDEGFNDDDYVYTEDEDDNAYPVPDADSVAAAAGLHSRKARALKLTGAGGINKAATDINEYATAVYLTAQLCVSGGAQSVKAQIIQTDSGTLRVNDQWATVVRDALAETQSRVPTIKEAVKGVTSAGGGGGGGGGGGAGRKSSSALREAENAVKILRDKGNKLLGADGVAAMIGLIQTKIDQSYMMAAVVVQTLQEHPFLMDVRENSKLPLVQVVGATSRPAAQISHMSAVKLFCMRYDKTDFCSFALTEGKVYEIKRLTFSEREDYHKRSPADILVAIDASCFASMQGYDESMAGLPLIIGLSLKSVLNYGQAPFANPGLSSVLGDLRKKLGDELVPNDIEGIVGDPYKRCVNHLMAAAGVKTKVALKNQFKSVKKKGDDIKLGQGGDQDKLLKKLAKKKVSGSDIGSTPRSRLLFCKKHLILVRDLLREKFQNILKVPGGQQAMKEHIIEVWKKIASPIYWFKVTGQGGHPSLKASSRSGQHKLTEGYKAEFIDPNKSLAMDFLKNPSSEIHVYDAGGGDTKVSFSLIVTLKGESIPLIQIRVKKESYMGSSLKLSGERCAGGICSVGAGGGGGGGGSGHSGGGASSRRKKKGGSRRKRRTRRKRRSRRKRRHTRKKKHHVRRRRRRRWKTRRKKY